MSPYFDSGAGRQYALCSTYTLDGGSEQATISSWSEAVQPQPMLVGMKQGVFQGVWKMNAGQRKLKDQQCCCRSKPTLNVECQTR